MRPQIYRSRPNLIQAMQLTPSSLHDVMQWINSTNYECWYAAADKVLGIQQLDNTILPVLMGDFVIQDERGTFSSSPPEDFLNSYESAGNANFKLKELA